MSTITATLEADIDGTLHLPLPIELRQGKIHVVATLEPAAPEAQPQTARCGAPRAGSLTGFWMAPDFDAPLEEFREYME